MEPCVAGAAAAGDGAESGPPRPVSSSAAALGVEAGVAVMSAARSGRTPPLGAPVGPTAQPLPHAIDAAPAPAPESAAARTHHPHSVWSLSTEGSSLPTHAADSQASDVGFEALLAALTPSQ